MTINDDYKIHILQFVTILFHLLSFIKIHALVLAKAIIENTIDDEDNGPSGVTIADSYSFSILKFVFGSGRSSRPSLRPIIRETKLSENSFNFTKFKFSILTLAL